jgi:hypothetical protein
MITQEKISLKNLQEGFQADQWQTIVYREGTKGELSREAVLKKVWIWKKGSQEIEEAEVLISEGATKRRSNIASAMRCKKS